jgi:hypothetical protein
MYQQRWGYKVEEKLYLGVREQKRLNTTDLSNAFDIVPLNLFICMLTDFGLSSGYATWFHRCLTNRQSPVRISGVFCFCCY